MKTIEQPPPPVGLGFNDILFSLHRRKWLILVCSLAGLAGAAAVYFRTPVIYESRAKLLVRYVVDRSSVDAIDAKTTAGPQNDTIINSEVEILTSLDLALQVVETLGDRLLPKADGAAGKANAKADAKSDAKSDALKSVLGGIKVQASKGSNVILVAYQNRDPELARTVLDELVKRYFDKHLEVHRSTGAFSFVTEQTQVARARLRLTEDELKKRKAEAGIISLADSTASINARVNKAEGELLVAETELAVEQARFKEASISPAGSGSGPSKAGRENANGPAGFQDPPAPSAISPPLPKAGEGGAAVPPAPVDVGEVERYKVLVAQISELRKSELALLSKYMPESELVKSARRQIEGLERQRREFEKKFPALFAVMQKPESGGRVPPDTASEKANLAASAAKVESLKAQLKNAQEQATRLAQVGPQIAELERKKEAEEANLKYMESGLERARIDEALDPSKIPNISTVQRPTMGAVVTGKTQKVLLGFAGGGIGLGVGLALIMELFLNRSIRRPLELETLLHIPQLLSIPYFPGDSKSRLRLENGSTDARRSTGETTRPQVAPWDPEHFIRTFSEEVRDRLILSFQIKNLTHKPKLVGIAGLSGGEGASTLASGLAAALSETGEGKVLLVDMNSRSSEAHSFLDGKPACGLAEALEANGSLPPVAENLYLATGSSHNGGAVQLATKRFYDLVPNLKASHFDYIIFDLPPISQGSATLSIAGCLDKLLFVVEAEKSDRHKVKRAYADLVAAKADVSGILNKTRSSGPKWLNA